MQEVRNIDGKVIGNIRDGVLRKKLKRSKHFMRVLNSWGLDTRILSEDFHTVKILDLENEVIYASPKESWLSHGIQKNFGHGDQTFLPLRHFEVISKNQPALIT